MSLKNKFLSYMKSCISMPWLTEVEYLSSAYRVNEGMGSYLDSGWVPNFNSDIDVRFVFAIPQDSALVRTILISNYGIPNISIHTSWGIETNAERKIRLYTDNGMVNLIGSTVLSTKTPYVVHYTYNASTYVHIINVQSLDKSVNETLTATYKPTNVQESCWMFKDKRSTLGAYHWITIYQMEIKNGLVHQKFLPCLDKHREAGMYEAISGKIYKNLGELPFQCGRRIIEVEWMNLTGKQYFNTRFKPNTLNTTLRTKFTFGGTAMMMGCRNNATYPQMCSIYMPAGTSSRPYSRIRLDWMAGTSGMFSNYLDSEVVELEITGNYAKVNGVEYTDTTKTSVDMDDGFRIGCAYTSNATNHYVYPSTGKIYFCELLNTYTRDDYRYCVPAHDENNVGFFFDRINHFIMDNEGTGAEELTWGDEIHPVSYLYGGGSSRFNTAIPFYDHAWETDVRCNSIRTNTNLMGSTTGACNYWGVYESDSQSGKTYTLHTSSSNYGLTIDPTEIRTVFLNMGLDTDNTTYKLTMAVEGENVARTASAANTTTGYRIPNFSESYSEPTYIYGNRCYNRTTKELIQNLVPVQNGQRAPFLFDTMSHTMITTTISNADFEKGADVLGYQTEPQLPYGFVEVDYLKSTGTQYIDTGIYGTQNTRFEVDLDIQSGAYQRVGGSFNDTSKALTLPWNNINDTSSQVFVRFGNFVTTSDNTPRMTTGRKTISVDKTGYYVDGTKLLDISYTGSFTTTGTLWLFSSNPSTGMMVGKIYGSKIYDNGTLVCDLVPALRTYDNKPGMFDLITRQFFTNQGTSEFIVGINGEEYTPLDYIESTGTQYINTNIMPKYNQKISIGVTGLTNQNLVYIGSRTSGTYETSTNQVYVNTFGANSSGVMFFHPTRDIVLDGFAINTKYDLTLNVNMDASTVYSYPYYLFALNNIGTAALASNQLRIHYCKVSNPNGVEMHYLPVVRQSDGVVGMYDLVSNKLITNAGTGSFVAGNR